MIAQTQTADIATLDVADLPGTIVVPQPRAAAPVAPVPTTVPAPADDHVELLAAELLSSAAVVNWVGRLTLLLALGLVAWLTLLP
ncbi:hypothetical protein ACR9E3_07200 [Actinomycetospora sp. C-140]